MRTILMCLIVGMTAVVVGCSSTPEKKDDPAPPADPAPAAAPAEPAATPAPAEPAPAPATP